MKMALFALKSIGGCLALFVAQIGVQLLLPIHVTAPKGVLVWLLLSDLLTAMAMGAMAQRAPWKRPVIAAALFGVAMVLMLSTAIEGIVFMPQGGINWPRMILRGIVTNLLVVPVWTLLFAGASDAVRVVESRAVRLKTFVVGSLAYTVMYFAAGVAISPFVANFYRSQHAVPQFGKMLAMQLLLRGPVFVGLCLLIGTMIGGARRALYAGIVFAVLSGLAPMLIPNPYFPDMVRYAHMTEITVVNFLFAVLVLRQSNREPLQSAANKDAVLA